jgi:hypothetical protein
MAQDFEQLMKDIFGEPISRLTKFETEQTKKLVNKAHEIAREAVRDDLARLQTEINELRSRVAVLEAERVAASNEQA